MKWLDKIPLSTLLIIALLMGIAPFSPEPHLVEKLRMFQTGELVRPIDVFDLFLHGTPVLLLVIKVVRQFLRGRAA